jgi:hypothetical protein
MSNKLFFLIVTKGRPQEKNIKEEIQSRKAIIPSFERFWNEQKSIL